MFCETFITASWLFLVVADDDEAAERIIYTE